MNDSQENNDEYVKDFLNTQDGKVDILPQWAVIVAVLSLLGVLGYTFWDMTLRAKPAPLVIAPYDQPLKKVLEVKFTDRQDDLSVLALHLPEPEAVLEFIDQNSPPKVTTDQTVADRLLSGDVDKDVALKASLRAENKAQLVPKAPKLSPDNLAAVQRELKDAGVDVPLPPSSIDDEVTGYLRDQPKAEVDQAKEQENRLRLEAKLLADIKHTTDQLEKLRGNANLKEDQRAMMVAEGENISEQNKIPKEIMDSLDTFFSEDEVSATDTLDSPIIKTPAIEKDEGSVPKIPDVPIQDESSEPVRNEVVTPVVVEEDDDEKEDDGAEDTGAIQAKQKAKTIVNIQEQIPKAAIKEVPKKAPKARSEYYVQVASLTSRQDAESTLKHFRKRHSDLLANYSLEVYEANIVNRGIFYRVYVAPFTGRNIARDWCRKLRNSGGDCIVIHSDS